MTNLGLKWEDLNRTQQAILADLAEDTPNYTAAYDDLVACGLIEEPDGHENTTAGQDLLERAERDGYLRFVPGRGLERCA